MFCDAVKGLFTWVMFVSICIFFYIMISWETIYFLNVSENLQYDM